MKILILGGFLGSGKTTALMSFARYLTNHPDQNKENRVVILENEVGEIGVDDTYLRGGGYTVSSLFAGCACCTAAGELTIAAKKIMREIDPEWLIIETTGIAYPRQMQENIRHSLEIEALITVLVDASRWKRLKTPMHDLLEGQIRGSDSVLINKIDLVSSEQLASVESDILAFDPDAVMLKISALNSVSDEIWESVAAPAARKQV
jgi:G3E family GTPase